MNFNFDNIKEVFSKKLLLQLYFIFFILLNVFDFLNFLSGDIDFFKKILSWILIGYVFYKASFSRMFVGVCDRVYDVLFLVGFCFMGITKSIFHYISISDLDSFFVFGWFLNLIPKTSEPFLTNSFLFGFFIVILSSIFLIKKHKISEDSLVGSFKFSEYLKFIGAEYFVLASTTLFFGLVVFNYIMEWFALAVDSIILVLGLIFYLFMFIHNHTSFKTGNILAVISNTGNEFYQNLINQFSNKKSFMIGVSFILVLHLLVDIGVYLIPFVTGLTNSLYGNLVVDAVPIFNLFDFSNSQFYLDLVTVNFEPISSISLFIVHFSSVVLFFLLMFLPFYYFYKNSSFEKIRLNGFVEVLFLVSLIINLFVFVMPNLTNPISVDWSFKSQVIGVDLNSNLILGTGSSAPIELILVLILTLFLIIESRYLLKSSINIFVRRKIISGIVLLFFSGYILVFGVSTISNEFDTTILKDRINSDKEEYEAIMNSYNVAIEDQYNSRIFSQGKTISANFYDISFTPYSTFDYKNPNVKSIDFLIVKLANVTKNKEFTIYNHKNSAVFNGDFATVKKYFASGEFTFIYKLGEDVFTYQKAGKGFRIINSPVVFDGKYIKVLDNTLIKLSDQSKVTNFVETIRLVILFIFYFGGLIVFTRHFFKTNVYRS